MGFLWIQKKQMLNSPSIFLSPLSHYRIFK